MTQRPENRKADDNCQTVGIIAAFNMVVSKDKEIKILPRVGHGCHKADCDKWLFSLPQRSQKSRDGRVCGQ